MYRIEVAPGEESVFRTLEELAVAIRNGVVTHRARIYHHASQKWLPIALHPHYKKAMAMQVGSAAQPPAASPGPLSALARMKARIEPQASPRIEPRPEPRPAASRPEPDPPTTPPAPATAHAAWPAPAPEPKPEPKPERKAIAAGRPAAELWPEPKLHAVAEIPPPVTSPVLAMQQEVLRDLPAVAIPEPRPLPWAPPAPRVAALPPGPAPAVRPPASAHVEPAPPASAARSAEPRHLALDEPAHPRPPARRSRRASGRPLLLLFAASALVIGTHLVLTAAPSPSAGKSDAAGPAELTTPTPSAGVTASPRVTTEPARVVMTPGPAFAGSAPARVRTSSTAPQTTAPATANSPVPRATRPAAASRGPDSAPPIAPAPAALDLALPVVPSDSVAPAARAGDTTAMKRILRALNGAPAKASPAP